MREGRNVCFGVDADFFVDEDGEAVMVTQPYAWPVFYLLPRGGNGEPGAVRVWEAPEGDPEGEAWEAWEARRAAVLRMRPMTREEDGADYERAIRDEIHYELCVRNAAREAVRPSPTFAELDAEAKANPAPPLESDEERWAREDAEAREREERDFRRDLIRAIRAPRAFLGVTFRLGGRDR